MPSRLRILLEQLSNRFAISYEHSLNELLGFGSFASSLKYAVLDPLHSESKYITGANYYITIADSGMRKSATQDFFKAPLQALEAEYIQQYMRDMRIYEAEARVLKNASGSEIELPAEAPVNLAFLFDDLTLEGLIMCLSDGNLPSGFILSAEGAQFFTSNGMSSENATKVYGALNSLWSGEPVSTTRAKYGGKRIIPAGALLSMNIALQEKVFGDHIATEQAEAVGFTSRLLISHPDFVKSPTAKERIEGNWDDQKELLIFRQHVHLGVRNAIDQYKKAKQLPVTKLTLSKKALSLYCEAYDSLQNDMEDNNRLCQYRAFASKLPEHILRICVAMYFIEGGRPDCLISPEIMRGAIYLGIQFYMENHMRLISAGSIEELKLEGFIRRGMHWLEKKRSEGRVYISYQEIHQGFLKRIPKNSRNKVVLGLCDKKFLTDLRNRETVPVNGKPCRSAFKVEPVQKNFKTLKVDANDEEVINTA